MTRTLLHWHPEIAGSTVLEPAAGDDDISDALRRAGCTVLTNDLDPRHNTQWHMDATTPEFWAFMAHAQHRGVIPKIDYVVSNFPFNIAMEILPHAVACAPTAVVLRKTFLEPTEDRGPWLSAHSPSGFIGLPRHSFRGDSTDSVTCDWMQWGLRRLIAIDPLAKSR